MPAKRDRPQGATPAPSSSQCDRPDPSASLKMSASEIFLKLKIFRKTRQQRPNEWPLPRQ